MNPERRVVLGALSYPAAAAAAAWTGVDLTPRARAVEYTQGLGASGEPVEKVAADESRWFEVQQAFTVDRSMINLNNGGVCPSPAVVQAAVKRHLDHAHEAPAYVLWQLQAPQKETPRAGVAALFGCDPEEIALVRNASEGLQICQLGLDLKRGDEVLTTNQDYPRMLTTFKQRERRDGIVLKQFPIPVPCEDPRKIVALFEENLTPRTRMILMCQVVNLTGQILPVKEISRVARRVGVPLVVDGAHGFAHLTQRHADLECDMYASSLHKWLLAPHGTGMLYVRRERIKDLWPLMAAPPEMDENVRKFEEIGTHAMASYLAIAEALSFHNGIGAALKEARLRHLRDQWAKRLLETGRVRLHTSLDPRYSAGIGCFQVEGVDSVSLNSHLWARHRIFTTTVKHASFEGVRVTPNVYTTLSELDRFCSAVEVVIRDGLPKA